ncbi:MAG: DUF4240 domain-containing protein [Bacillota bacterium]
MNKYIILILSILFLLLIGGPLKYIIINLIAEPMPLERKNNISDSAIWYGGVDGGDWISCEDYNSNENLFYCEIYNDNTGGLKYKGLFKYTGNDTISLGKIKDKIIAFDGDNIYLDIIGDNGKTKKLIGVDKMDDFNISKLNKSNRMMNEEKFWAIVEDSIKNNSSQEEQKDYLISKLSQMSPVDMIGFRLRTDKLLYDSYIPELWCAAYIINYGCSDDGFEYFRNWLISRGKEVYYRAIENPDSLINEIEEDNDFYEFESFWYVALEAFEKRTNNSLYDYIDYDNFITREDNYPSIEFNWNDDNPETMKKICPLLFERFWKE